MLMLPVPSSTAFWPSSAPLRAKVRRPASGPLALASSRLKPTEWFTPNGSSLWAENEPVYLSPPVLVTMLMMPDLALPNSAEEEPVVTEASSKALVEMLSEVPADPANRSPR